MRESKRDSRIQSVYEWAESLLFGLTAVLLVFTFLFKTYAVSGSSMEPTLLPGERVFAFSAFREPRPGDIVIVDRNNNLGIMLVKRVIACGGQTVALDPATGAVLVDGEPIEDAVPASAANFVGDITYPFEVPQGCLFVMGDNRAVSLDSRFGELGVVDARAVLGRAVG